MGWIEIASTSLFEGIQCCVDPGSLFTDCVVSVEGKEFPCHRIILSAYSKFFQAMFTSGMKEDINGRVKLEDVSQQVFANILDALYKGIDIVDEDNALEIWRVTNMLQIDCLKRHTENFLITHLSVDNCISFWREAQYSENFNSEVLAFITKEFQAIKSGKDFLSLNIVEMTQLIASDDLNVSDEMEVVDAILQWIREDKVCRKGHVFKLLSLVRLKCVPEAFTAAKLLSEEMVTENKDVMAMVQQSLLHHTSPDRRHDECLPGAVLRKSNALDNVLLVMGTTINEFYAYQLKTGLWFQVEKPPEDLGTIAACSYGETIYVSGGDYIRAFYQFDVCSNRWLELSLMTMYRTDHAQVAVGHYLYLIGGESDDESYLDSVECYNIKKDQWSVVGKLDTPVHSAGVAVSGKRLIVCGGETEDGVTSKVQCFDTETNTCHLLGHMLQPSLSPQVLYKAGKIYLVSDVGEVSEMLLEDDHSVTFTKLTRSPLWSFTRTWFGAALYNDSLLCISGKESQLENIVDVDIPDLCKQVQNLRLPGLDRVVCLHTVMDKGYLNKPV